jgi:hypothetical protein
MSQTLKDRKSRVAVSGGVADLAMAVRLLKLREKPNRRSAAFSRGETSSLFSLR